MQAFILKGITALITGQKRLQKMLLIAVTGNKANYPIITPHISVTRTYLGN